MTKPHTDLREELEELCIGFKPGSTKGRQTSGRFYLPQLAKFITARQDTLIDQIGEPGLNDFNIKPDSYEDVLKVVRWYKERLASLRSNNSKAKET